MIGERIAKLVFQTKLHHKARMRRISRLKTGPQGGITEVQFENGDKTSDNLPGIRGVVNRTEAALGHNIRRRNIHALVTPGDKVLAIRIQGQWYD